MSPSHPASFADEELIRPFCSMITGGQLAAYAVSAGLNNVHNGWRILFALSLPFAIGQGIGMHWLPETPRFAVLSGRTADAEATLARIYPKATPEQLQLKLKAIALATDVSTLLKKKHPSLIGRIYAVCSTPRYLRCTVCAAVVFLGPSLFVSSRTFALTIVSQVNNCPAGTRSSTTRTSSSVLPASTTCARTATAGRTGD